PKVLLPRSQQSRPLNSLHLRMAPSLDLVLGEWEDANGNHYDVTLDETGESCSVRTVRSNGRIQNTRNILRRKDNYVKWGNSYYLEINDKSMSKLKWTPLKNVQPYTWFRCNTEEKENDQAKRTATADVKKKVPGPKTEKTLSEEENSEPTTRTGEEDDPPRGGPVRSKPVATLDEVTGDWKDCDGIRYFITLDESGDTCSATTVTTNGQTSLDMAVITEEDGWLYWRNSHYLDAKDQESLRWRNIETEEEWTWKHFCAGSASLAVKSAKPATWAFGFVLLGQTVGRWIDDQKRHYTVTMDERGNSCSVEFERGDGRNSLIPAFLKYNADLQRVMYGTQYYLQVKGAGEIAWIHLGWGQQIRWYLCKSSKSTAQPLYVHATSVAYDLKKAPKVGTTPTKTSPSRVEIPKKGQRPLKEIVGRWMDHQYSCYTVTLDDSLQSCSVRTQRKDGRVRFTKGMLSYDEATHCIWWGNNYYLMVGPSPVNTLTWTPVNPNRQRAYTWHRC
ncbi:unnamed protein product, partial [Durusdinium trenchii]